MYSVFQISQNYSVYMYMGGNSKKKKSNKKSGQEGKEGNQAEVTNKELLGPSKVLFLDLTGGYS